MRFLSVADRELRAAARRKATYRARWLTALVFFGLLLWLLWAFHGFSNRRVAPEIFKIFSVCTLVYCLFVGAARTADSISAERREGTLGLLFLTNLNSFEIIAGKLCSTALASVYGLMAIFPMLALPLLMGGITFGHFARTILALLNAILFALCAGFLASVLFKRQFTAIATALGLTLGWGGGLMLAAAAAASYAPTRPLAHSLAGLSPLYTVLAADGTRFFGTNSFFHSAAVVTAVALTWLGLAVLLLARTWRDRPKTAPVWRWLRGRRTPQSRSARRAALRRRLLEMNPFFWLAAPRVVSAPVFMGLAVVLTTLTVYVTAPLFGRALGASVTAPVLGHLLAWLWTGLALHALVLYYAAMVASQRLAEDKQTGALELILCTPATERTISRGLWLAYARRMLFPGLAAVLVHLFFVWVCLVMLALEPPGQLPPGTSVSEIFWSSLLNRPLRGRVLDWQFGFILRLALLSLLQLMATWPTLGLVGRWLGLRMKHPGFAPITSLLLLVVPPVLLFSFACYVADKLNFDRLPERRFVPAMMWLALAMGLAHCLALSRWASSQLRRKLRSVAMSRYQPLPAWQWRLPDPRVLGRWTLTTAGAAVLLGLLVAGFYAYENWRTKQAWRAFQASLKQRSDSLQLAPLMPQPVPDRANFARSPAFVALLGSTNTQAAALFKSIYAFAVPVSGNSANIVLTEWRQQKHTPLASFLDTGEAPKSPKARRQPVTRAAAGGPHDAPLLWQALQPHQQRLAALAAAAAASSAFQPATNRNALAVFHAGREESALLERLHLLYQVRACVALALSNNASAAEDLKTGLRLAQFARRLPDACSTARVNFMLMRSLQPLWEGLDRHAWSESQLAPLQQELARFNLLADYTNAVCRVVLAHIELWRAIPDSTNSHPVLPAWGGSYMTEEAWSLQPRAWWFESCMQLHQAGQNLLEQVDMATGRFSSAPNWSDLDGLPLDGPTRELLQQGWWSGANSVTVSFVQTAVNQALIACALERFWLTNRAYPETLQPLVPSLLEGVPHDAMSGRPLLYQRLDDGKFMLVGVGPNGTDDRGKKASDDWVWSCSTNTPSAAQ